MHPASTESLHYGHILNLNQTTENFTYFKMWLQLNTASYGFVIFPGPEVLVYKFVVVESISRKLLAIVSSQRGVRV